MMKERHTAEETRAHFRDVIKELKSCVLCLGNMDPEEENRGIIEFYDGWFWICSKCRQIVAGTLLDMTQSEDWGTQEVIPYFKRSRKRWLKYLEEEHQIIIKTSISNTIRGYLNSPMCFGLTSKGNPKHPLYLPKNANLEKYR